jgi:hypothetical protein
MRVRNHIDHGLQVECSVQIQAKSIPAPASVCITPRPRVSHTIVPSAIPPALSAALSLLVLIICLDSPRGRRGLYPIIARHYSRQGRPVRLNRGRGDVETFSAAA